MAKQDPRNVGSDGWPSWMGDADPKLAPKPPPKPKSVKPVQALASRPAAQPVAAAAPASPAPIAPTRRGLRSLVCGVLIVFALVGGELAAQARPDAALRFEHAAGAVPWQIVAGVAVALFAMLVWQAGRPRRPLFIPIAIFLCVMSAGFGLCRGGHDIDLERTATRVRSLESEIGKLQQRLDKATGSVRQSSLAIQEREEALSKLRREIDELKKKLGEKQ